MKNKVEKILKGFKPPFYYETFQEFYKKCGFNRKDVSNITNRNNKTILRWESSDAPKEFYLLIYCAAGFLLSEPFYGFRIKDNALWTGTRITYNYGFSSNEIINFSFFNDRANSLQNENEVLKEKIKKLESDFNLGNSNIVKFSASRKRK